MRKIKWILEGIRMKVYRYMLGNKNGNTTTLTILNLISAIIMLGLYAHFH